MLKATFEDSMKDEAIARNHSTTKEAIAVGTSAGAYRIILTHFTNPGTNPCLAIPLKDVCSTFLNIYGQDLDNDQRYIRTLHPREQKQQKVSRSLRLQTSQVFVTPLPGLGCCRSFRNTTYVRLDSVVVGEAEQPARELLDAGDGRWRSLPRTVSTIS
ncbi:uncharacterized protein LOC124650330 [Lolium rigidum]|uniref:uncharacterized protein LOC124650330 n=1 Tax=Lolium rigidum TaxID=89674 RepID=UPI001F5D5F85|nr:uncharacterized protein LOC124650330 [Lolium rigidum]